MLRTLVLASALALTPLAGTAQAPSAAAPSASAPSASAQSASAESASPAVAQPAPETQAPAAAPARPSATSADTGAVPVPQPTEKALRYFRGNTALWFVGILWGLLLPALALFTGLSARVRDFAERIGGRRWFFTVAIYGIIITLLAWLAGLPLAWYSEFVREHAYGLSNQSLGKWLGDSLKGLALSMVGIALVLWMPYGLLRRSPRRWWLWTGLGAIPLIVLLIFVSPIWIDPLFNRFGPMQDERLEARILSLAQRAGIEGGRVYEVEKSADTETVNAYVTGFGGTKRIVLWDTILRKLDDRQLLFVMGHEMGHYVLRHVLMNLVLSAALILLALYAVHRLAGWFIARWKHRFGFDRLDDVASLPLLGLIVSLVSLVVTPVPLAFSRWAEHEADRFGLELTRDNRAAAEAFARLQGENLSVPYHSTLYKLWNDSHPPIGERIDFINGYRPWATGQPLRYGDRFEAPPAASP
ncbi:MAG TPA: M48 family metallopeptidase [Longimicrobium sp.]|nr:M48 family metallopeptidase [Longimicrobium sp.]